jgi:hypothetical protein
MTVRLSSSSCYFVCREVARPGFPEAGDDGQVNLKFMKKLPKNAEAAAGRFQTFYKNIRSILEHL